MTLAEQGKAGRSLGTNCSQVSPILGIKTLIVRNNNLRILALRDVAGAGGEDVQFLEMPAHSVQSYHQLQPCPVGGRVCVCSGAGKHFGLATAVMAEGRSANPG